MPDKQPFPTGVQLTAADPVFRERPHEYLDRLRTVAHRGSNSPGRRTREAFSDPVRGCAGGRFEPGTLRRSPKGAAQLVSTTPATTEQSGGTGCADKGPPVAQDSGSSCGRMRPPERPGVISTLHSPMTFQPCGDISKTDNWLPAHHRHSAFGGVLSS